MVPNVYIWTTEARVHNLLKSVQCPFTQNPIDYWLSMSEPMKLETVSRYNKDYAQLPEEDVLRSWEISDLSLDEIDACVRRFSKALNSLQQDPRTFIVNSLQWPISDGYERELGKPDPHRENYTFGDHMYRKYLVEKARNGWLWLNNLDCPRARTMYGVVSRIK